MIEKVHIKNNSKPIIIYCDILGFPIKIGNRVRILDNPNKDETFDNRYTFKIGIVTYFEYNCGCGQSYPSDPMIGVKFGSGKIEEFWKEEIIIID